MNRPIAYEGKEPFIFISYSHKDSDRVMPIIEGLQQRGFRVWYDEGIEWGSHWDEEIFNHLAGSAHVVAFVTENFLQSENCMDEIHYAKEKQKGPLILYLDNLELPERMKYRYGRIQALALPRFENMHAFMDALCRSRTLSPCCGAAAPAIPKQTPAKPVVAPAVPSQQELEQWTQEGTSHYNKGEYAEAVRWYRKAAEQGHARAQCNLGYCYANGQGVTKD